MSDMAKRWALYGVISAVFLCIAVPVVAAASNWGEALLVACGWVIGLVIGDVAMIGRRRRRKRRAQAAG
jgi:hypothetical protein